jgi:hypothetical protein
MRKFFVKAVAKQDCLPPLVANIEQNSRGLLACRIVIFSWQVLSPKDRELNKNPELNFGKCGRAALSKMKNSVLIYP